MVRFATDPDTSHTPDETRAFRGAHVAIFEDDDKGTALKALVPSLSWMVADGAPALPFGEFADFTLRFMTWQAADRATQRLVITSAPSIVPINRCWKLVLTQWDPAAVGAVAPASTLSRRGLRDKVKAALGALPADRLDALDVVPTDWMERIALPTNLNVAPFSVHAAWLQHLSWNLLAEVGSMDIAADLLYTCGSMHADDAYTSAASPTRVALGHIATAVRACTSDPEGEDLAREVAAALRSATPPAELVTHVPVASRVSRAKDGIKIALCVGDEPAALEARLLRRLLSGDEALLGTPALRALTAGTHPPDAERILLEAAAAEGVADRSYISISLLHRLERALQPDVGFLQLPEQAAKAPAGRLGALLERRRARALALEVAPSLGHGTGSSGAAGAPEGINTTAKPYHSALVEQLGAHTFTAYWGDAQPLLGKPDDGSVRAGVTLLLTGEGAPKGGSVETTLGASPAILGIFHQIYWGKLTSIPLKVELDSFVKARAHSARLLGRAAVDTLLPEGAAGAAAILSLAELDAAIRNGGKPLGFDGWRSLNLPNLLMRPLYRAIKPVKLPVVADAEAYTDELRLRSLIKPGAAVFALLGSPDEEVDSFAACISAAADYLELALGINDDIDRRVRKAVQAYITGSIAEWGTAYDDARFSQDVRVALPRAFVRPLSQAALDFAEARKIIGKCIDEARAAYLSDAADEEVTPTKESKKPKVDKTPSDDKRGYSARDGILTVTASGARYDFRGAIARFKDAAGGTCLKYAFLRALSLKPAKSNCGNPTCQFTHTGSVAGLRVSDFRLGAGGVAGSSKGAKGALQGDDGATDSQAEAPADGTTASTPAASEAAPATAVTTTSPAPAKKRPAGTGDKPGDGKPKLKRPKATMSA